MDVLEVAERRPAIAAEGEQADARASPGAFAEEAIVAQIGEFLAVHYDHRGNGNRHSLGDCRRVIEGYRDIAVGIDGVSFGICSDHVRTVYSVSQ